MLKIKEFFKRNWRAIGILILAAGLIIYNTHLYRQAAIDKIKAQIAEHNLTVAEDSIRVIKDRAGKDEYNKLAYLTNQVSKLQDLNNELFTEVKNIKGKVSTIIQGEIKVIEKPVPFIVRGEFLDSTFTAHFNYDTVYSIGNYRRLSGYTRYNLRSGVISGLKETDEFGIKIITGIKNLDQNKPEIFFKSDYPGFQITSLEGAVLDPKLFQPKKSTPLITPSLTVGWNPLIWNGKEQIVQFTPNSFGVTIGVGFNLFKVLGIKK